MLNRVEVPKEHIYYSMPQKHQFRPTELPPEFEGAAYLRVNPDVARANVDPARHWLEFGYREGRPLLR